MQGACRNAGGLSHDDAGGLCHDGRSLNHKCRGLMSRSLGLDELVKYQASPVNHNSATISYSQGASVVALLRCSSVTIESA